MLICEKETQHICQKIHVAYSVWTLKATKTQMTHCHKDKLLNLLHCVQQTLIKKRPSMDLWRAWQVADCVRRCLNCIQAWHYSLWRHFSWKHEASAAIIASLRVLTRETQQNKYVNKDVFGIPKGEGKGLHLSLFKNDYPVTIPPKLKWSFFSLKVNKWQEWDLQPGFSVSQFSSTNH